MEQRSIQGDIEVRQGPSGKPMLVGYAAVFNRSSEPLGGFVEQVDPQAFAKTIQEADVRALANHDPNRLLGRVKAGTMRLSTDERGLRYEVDINADDPDGQSALQKVKRGDWDGSSFSFRCISDSWNWDAQPPERRLMEVALVDVGPVTFPAYPDASVAARALELVARQVGRPAEALAQALAAGEIRSLIGGSGDASTDPPATPPADPPEDRAGKRISAATRAQIGTVITALQGLLGDPDADGDDDNEEKAAALDAEFRELLRDALVEKRDDQTDPPAPPADPPAGPSPQTALMLAQARARAAEAEAAVRHEARQAVGSTSLALGDRDEKWDGGAAEKAMTTAAQMRAGHFYYDASKPADQISSYKLPFASGGHAVWGAITAVAAALQGSRGGVSIPAADAASIKTKVEAYYAKARAKYDDDTIKVPWS